MQSSIFLKGNNPEKMMIRTKRHKRSFDPNAISIELHEALKRDLHSPRKLEYGDPEVVSRYTTTQIDKFLSKFSPEGLDTSTLEREAFAKFLRTNDYMALINRHFENADVDDPVAVPEESLPTSRIILLRARKLAHYVLTPLTEDEFFLGCKSSGGSSIGVPYSNTAPEKKYSYPISVSSEKLIPLWNRYRLFNPEFSEAVHQMNDGHILGPRFKLVVSSRATTVEKSTDSRRMIAVEPTLNMFFQQGLMDALTRRLSVVGIDLSRVPYMHTQLAMRGSITASLDTVDFSSASDSVSYGLLKWLIPPKWFELIKLVRSPSMLVDGKTVDLEMISTMGNATTFPIETLVFWCIAVSSAMTVARPNSNDLIPDEGFFSSVSVFGDDCILPSEVTAHFMAATSSVGFVINIDKSFFNGGYFRESCGGDYYRGRNVRPYYLRAPSSTRISALEPWLYSIFNGILEKYISYFGSRDYVYDKEFFKCIFRVLRKERLYVKIVPNWLPDDAGLKIGDEYHRFSRAYDFTPSRVSQGTDGNLMFSYCRFNYRHKEPWDEKLRYSLLKKRAATYIGHRGLFSNLFVNSSTVSKRTPIYRRQLRHENNIRRIGGYVVATGFTPCWSPNIVQPGIVPHKGH